MERVKENEATEIISITTKAKEDRSQVLIANFVDGFAAGWRMAVPEWFKDSLDIKLTPKTIKNKKQLYWTQGNIFNFQVGHTLYDQKESYGNWQHHLDYGKLLIQIHDAKTSGYVDTEIIETKDEYINIFHHKKNKKPEYIKIKGLNVKKQKLQNGIVRFRVYRVNKEKTKVEECELIECTQENFVVFLQTGIVYTTNKDKIYLLTEQE